MSGEDGNTNGTPCANALGTAPHRPDGAQAGGVPGVQRLKSGIDRLGALQGEHRDRGSVVVARGVEVGHGPRDPHVSVALERVQPPRGGGRVGGGVRGRDRREGRDLDHAVIAHDRIPRLRAGRRRADGEDPSAQPARAHPRQIQVPTVTARHDSRVVIAGQGVVVSVKHRQHDHGRYPSRPLGRTYGCVAD